MAETATSGKRNEDQKMEGERNIPEEDAKKEGKGQMETDTGKSQMEPNTGYREEEKPSKQKAGKLRLWLSASAIVSWLGMGLFAEISGPTLTFLKLRIGVDYVEISRALVARSSGYLLGSLLAGILCQKWSRHSFLWISVSLIAGGLATCFEPWSPTLWLLALLFFCDGLAKGVIATGAQFVLFMLWGAQAAVPTHALHCAFGIGALLGPQIAKPFLPGHNGSSSCMDPARKEALNRSIPGNDTVIISDDCYGGGARIEYPYLIVGVVVMGIGFYMFLLQLIVMKLKVFGNGHKQRDAGDAGDPPSAGIFSLVKNSRCFIVMLIALFFVLWALPVGAERAYGKFLFAFATDSEQQFSAQSASDLMILFWSTFTAGRALAAVLSHWMSQFYLLTLELTVGVASTVLLSIMGHNQSLALWICTAVFAATLSPIYPGALSWTNEFFPMSSMMTGLAYVGTAAGSIAFSWLSGYLFEFFGPRSLMLFMLAYSCLALTLVILIYVITLLNPFILKDFDNEKVDLELKEPLNNSQIEP